MQKKTTAGQRGRERGREREREREEEKPAKLHSGIAFGFRVLIAYPLSSVKTKAKNYGA